MEKLTQQDVVDALVQKSGLTRKVSERLGKTFFDVIIDGLQADEAVKINGLGTFKVITVADRESVNVNNGERIVIPGYKKVTFTPAATVELNDTETEPEPEEEEPIPEEPEQEQEEEELINEESEAELEETVEEEAQSDEVVLEEPVVGAVEVPANEFGGIDMLISTPESVEEVRLQYEVAKRRAAETLRQANEANAEMKRLERLLSNLQANTTPEEPVPAPEQEVEEQVIEQPVAQTVEVPVEAENEAEKPEEQGANADDALQHYLQDTPIHTEEDIEEEKSKEKKTNWFVYTLIVVLLGVAAAFCAIMLYKYNHGDFDQKDDVKTEVKTEQKKPATPVAPKKSDAETKKAKPAAMTSQEAEVLPTPAMAEQKTPSKPVGSAAAQKPQKQQRTYVMKAGDTLTKLAKQTYGSKDSVKVIIRANKFDNPDNVPIGAVVILP